ncbi:MAG: VOC family protein [Candidatus Micrarchaeota archaeon]|nr:VOC family protein [Candidatus Micrarchaeota archaeon]
MDPTLPRIGHVHLTVSHIGRAVEFYTELLGMDVTEKYHDGSAVFMSYGGYHHHVAVNVWAGEGAKPPARGHTGLYHFALLYPSRKELAKVVQRLIDAKYPLTGAADHGVSESVYISDPDGNGIELTVDRPREQWPREKNGSIRMEVLPLDLDALLDELKKK